MKTEDKRKEKSELDVLKNKYDNLKKKYDALQKKKDIFQVALRLTSHTITIVDIEKKSLGQIYNVGSWNGIQDEMENAPESIIETGIIYSEDVDGYRQFYKEIYGGFPRGNCSIRVLGENNHWFWFTMYYKTMFDDVGNPKYAICFSDDLTSKHEVELMYEQYMRIVRSNAEALWEINLTKNKVLLNDETLTSKGIPFYETFEQMNESGIQKVVEEDREKVRTLYDRKNLLKAFYDGNREMTEKYRFNLDDNSKKPTIMEAQIHLLMNGDEDVCMLLAIREMSSMID